MSSAQEPKPVCTCGLGGEMFRHFLNIQQRSAVLDFSGEVRNCQWAHSIGIENICCIANWHHATSRAEITRSINEDYTRAMLVSMRGIHGGGSRKNNGSCELKVWRAMGWCLLLLSVLVTSSICISTNSSGSTVALLAILLEMIVLDHNDGPLLRQSHEC